MRRLLYVPIIHMGPDLGSLASVIDKRSIEICGEERWAQHKKTVLDFWDSIATYFIQLKIPGLKIYQDGLMANGETGRRIIEEGAKRGSKNHEVVLDLMRRGGVIMATEDIALLKEEYDRLIKLAQSGSPMEKIFTYTGHILRKDRLLQERDSFVAKKINETLKDGETGVLFLGVHHDVLPQLSEDTRVQEVKGRKKVMDYFNELVRGRNEQRFKQLAKYLKSPVTMNLR